MENLSWKVERAEITHRGVRTTSLARGPHCLFHHRGGGEGRGACLILCGNAEAEMWEVLSHVYYCVCLKGGNA